MDTPSYIYVTIIGKETMNFGWGEGGVPGKEEKEAGK